LQRGTLGRAALTSAGGGGIPASDSPRHGFLFYAFLSLRLCKTRAWATALARGVDIRWAPTTENSAAGQAFRFAARGRREVGLRVLLEDRHRARARQNGYAGYPARDLPAPRRSPSRGVLPQFFFDFAGFAGKVWKRNAMTYPLSVLRWNFATLSAKSAPAAPLQADDLTAWLATVRKKD